MIIFDAANEYMGACYIILFQEDGGETVRSRNLNHALWSQMPWVQAYLNSLGQILIIILVLILVVT